MHIGGVDDKDFTYFNGTQIGGEQGWNKARVYTIAGNLVKEGNTTVAIRIMDKSGNGGISGNDQSFYLEGPDGSKISLAGNWKSKKDADYSCMPARPVNMYNEP